MTAIGGVFSRRGGPWSPRVLHGLGRDLQPIGPDGETTRTAGPVGMIVRRFDIEAPASGAAEPWGERDGFLIAWNGRLDNRDEIEALLPPRRDGTEASLALASYRAWGIDCFRRLIGDFALALWDPDERRLVLATDPLGIRHLYYHATPDFLYWASRARPLLEPAGLSPEPDEEYVAGFLARHRSFARSAFSGISRLEPASVLVATADKVTSYRYWSPDSSREIRYRHDEDYEDHFRDLLHRAVACRLRAEGPIYCELSGGLDSSSIVCVADEIAAERGVLELAPRTVSYVYDRATLSDERRFISAVEAHRGRPGLHIREDDFPLLEPPSGAFQPDQPTGQLAYLARHRELARRMAESGARLLLRGFGGDEVTWSSVGPGPLELADLLRRHRVSTLLRRCRMWSDRTARPFLRTLWWGGVWPVLPAPLRARLGPFGREEFYRRLLELATPRFARRLDLRSRILGPGTGSGLRLPSQRHQFSTIQEMAHFVVPELVLDQGWVQLAYPFYDRRLVEFVLAIPMEQQLRPGETRSLARRALVDTLPEAVRTRRTKSGPEEAFHRTLLRQWPLLSPLLEDPLVSRYGFVDRVALARVLRQARHGVQAGPLLRILCLEFWLGSLDRDGRRRAGVHPLQAQQQNKGGSNHEDLRGPRSVRAG